MSGDDPESERPSLSSPSLENSDDTIHSCFSANSFSEARRFSAPTAYTGIDSSRPIARLGAGQLFRQEGVAVARFLHRLGFDHADVADLTQTVFLIAHQKGGFVPGTASARSWLYSIAYRVAAGERRKRHRHGQCSLDSVALADGSDPEMRVLHLQSLERVQSSLAQLPLLDRVTFVLYEVEGLSGDELANTLGVPVGTAYRRVHTARRKFAEAYRRERQDDD